MQTLLEIAPMVDWSYSHFRVLMRLLAPNSLVYTEMHTPGSVLNAPEKHYFHPCENPIAFQLGGSNPKELADACQVIAQLGYNEINLNLGCPSDKVQHAKFGACLLKTPELVADCLQAMHDTVALPITAKIRIGVDEHEGQDFLNNIASKIHEANVSKLIVHARKAWLTGLNPKQNRTVPPIQYEAVYNLKKNFPSWQIVINGDIKNYSELSKHLQIVDGVMVGRLAMDNPYELAKMHKYLYGYPEVRPRKEIIADYIAYIIPWLKDSTSWAKCFKPLFGMVHGLSGARQWRALVLQIIHEQNIYLVHSLVEKLPLE